MQVSHLETLEPYSSSFQESLCINFKKRKPNPVVHNTLYKVSHVHATKRHVHTISHAHDKNAILHFISESMCSIISNNTIFCEGNRFYEFKHYGGMGYACDHRTLTVSDESSITPLILCTQKTLMFRRQKYGQYYMRLSSGEEYSFKGLTLVNWFLYFYFKSI